VVWGVGSFSGREIDVLLEEKSDEKEGCLVLFVLCKLSVVDRTVAVKLPHR
jgi:hypothetical protein